jgi:hypothetical protein
VTKQWVQHISGQGEKWEVISNGDLKRLEWIVYPSTGPTDDYKEWFYLPKSEYRLCDPPEVWKDVTEKCEIGTAIIRQVNIGEETWHAIYHKGQNVMWPGHGYQLRKVQVFNGDGATRSMWAFVVERKVTE